MNNSRWTKEEEETVKDLWGRSPVDAIATRVNRTVASVNKKAQRLGIVSPNYTFDTAGDKLKIYNLTLLNFNTTQNPSRIRCYCGIEFMARLSDIFAGSTSSCGCFRRT